RRLCRHRPQTLGDENLSAHPFGALLPLLFRRGRREWKIAIEVFGRFEANVIGELAVWENAQRGGVRRSRENQNYKRQQSGREASATSKSGDHAGSFASRGQLVNQNLSRNFPLSPRTARL